MLPLKNFVTLEFFHWLLLHVSPTYNVLRHMYIVLPDDLAKGKRLVGGIVPVVTVVVVDPVVIVVAAVV